MTLVSRILRAVTNRPASALGVLLATALCHLGTKTSLLVSMWSHEYWEPVRTKCQTVVMAGTPPDASQVPVQAVMLP